tara:strand:- start:1889 stop:2527 length:639 start_codon:yes stop_codon:yes gene_type:complete
VCADPNAARAKQQHQEKLYNWYNTVAQDHNLYASYNTALDRAATGLSRAYSDTDEAYLSAASAVRATSANNLRTYLSSKDSGLSSQEGRSRTAGRKWLSKYLAEQGKLDAQLDQLGTSLFKGYRKSELEYLNYTSKAREQLGLPPLKPPATLVPRKNKLTQAAKIGLMIGGAVMTGGASLAGTGGTFMGMSSATAGAWGAGLSTAGSIIPDY